MPFARVLADQFFLVPLSEDDLVPFPPGITGGTPGLADPVPGCWGFAGGFYPDWVESATPPPPIRLLSA